MDNKKIDLSNENIKNSLESPSKNETQNNFNNNVESLNNFDENKNFEELEEKRKVDNIKGNEINTKNNNNLGNNIAHKQEEDNPIKISPKDNNHEDEKKDIKDDKKIEVKKTDKTNIENEKNDNKEEINKTNFVQNDIEKEKGKDKNEKLEDNIKEKEKEKIENYKGDIKKEENKEERAKNEENSDVVKETNKQENNENQRINLENQNEVKLDINNEKIEEENNKNQKNEENKIIQQIFDFDRQEENFGNYKKGEEEDNELAKRIEDEENDKEKEEENRKKLEEERKQIEEEEEKVKRISSYENSINELLSQIKRDWVNEEKTFYENRYEYIFINKMNELFNKVNDDESIKDEILVLIFKFICEYFESKKNYLNEVPWAEIKNIRKILLKENFEDICIFQNNKLLIESFYELLKKYNIDNTNSKIIEYNNNIFIKYLNEFLFRNGFFELYIQNVLTREDENNIKIENYIYDSNSEFISDLLGIILCPLDQMNFCYKEYLIKNNYHEKYIEKFLKKIDIIMNSTVLKEEMKKLFYKALIEKYKEIIDNMFNKIINEFKAKNLEIFENFIIFIVKIGEFYLRRQKLESRIYSLSLITEFIGVLQNLNKNDKNGKLYIYIKECVIKYMTKINIYNLIFGENIHEALVQRSYNLLSFLYKNKAFKAEQIKHLWNLSQDKYQTISDNIIALFGKLLPEFSTIDSNAILKIVSEMNLADVNEVTLKLLENFFNSNEKNEKLYNILYKLSDELSINEGLSKNIIIKSRNILVKLLFNQNYMKDLINMIKKSIFNIGKNYLVNTSLSILKLILEEFQKNQGMPEVKKILAEINPNIHNIELLIQYLSEKGDLFSVLFTNMLDIGKMLQFLIEETKNLKQIIRNKENFDNELALKLDELYKKFIDPEKGYYHNFGLNENVPEQIININPVRQVSSNQLDKTQSTEKSLNDGLIENEEEIEGNNQNIINNNEDIFNNDEQNWDFNINPEKYFKNIFKEYILFITNISLKNNNIFISEEVLISCVFNQFEFTITKNNYYQKINELLDIILSFWVMGKIQIDVGYLNFLYQITIKLGVINGKVLYYNFLNNILKKQLENKNILLLSDKVLEELILEKSDKYGNTSINQLPYEAFDFIKQFFIYFNQKFGNISYISANKKITSIQRYDLLSGMQILENYYIYSKDEKIYKECLDILTNVLTISAEDINNRKNILHKIFEFLKINTKKIKNDEEIRNYIIRELKLISIVNNTKVNNLLDPNDPENTIEIKVKNNYFNSNEDPIPFPVFKGIKIKDLKNKIIQQIVLSEENLKLYNEIMTLDNLTLHFNIQDLKQHIDKKGSILYYKGDILQDDLLLSDYNVEKDDCILIQSGEKKENKIVFEISEEKLKEGYEQINLVFNNMYEDEILKLAIINNQGNIENTILYLTDENNIENLKKEVENNKKKQQKKDNKKKVIKKEEDYIVPLEEEKIDLLLDILNEEDNLINEEIWKLFSEMKYPDSIINKATGVGLMNVIFEPNLYKMLLNLKLVNSLIFDDKFCKFNSIPVEIKLNWVSKFITNETFVSTILNKLNDIEENQNIIEEKAQHVGVKIQILSIFTNWFHTIFINLINVIQNKYIKKIVKDIVKSKVFSLHNNKNINIVNEIQNENNINSNGNNANSNNNLQHNQIEMVSKKEAKRFIKILNKNNIIYLFYKLLKTALNIEKNNMTIIISLLEMYLIYFSINKESIKIFLEEEKKEKILVQLISNDKNKGIRIIAFNFIKILVKNLNDFERKKKIKQKKNKEKENQIIKNEANSNAEKNIFINEKEENQKLENESKDKKDEINENKLKIENKEGLKKEEKENSQNNGEKRETKIKEENEKEFIESKEIKDINIENTKQNNINENISENIIRDEGNKNKEENEKENKKLKEDNFEARNNQLKESENKERKNEEISDKKDDEIEEDEIEEEEEIKEDSKENTKNLMHYILLTLYKEKIISEELYSQEFYMLFGFLLSFKEIKFEEQEKEKFFIYLIISYLIEEVYKKGNLSGEAFIEKKFILMYNIYILCCCHKYYSCLIQYYLEKNDKIDLIQTLYECLFEVNNINNIVSYKFDWDDLCKHSYNLLSNIISLDSKYLYQIFPKILKNHNKFTEKKQGISIDFKLRDPIHDKLIGLRNFGATCYLNSLFQQMFMNPLFFKDLFSFNIQVNSNLENSVIYNMQMGFANLKYSCLNVYPPYNFVKSFKKAFNGEPIQFGVQQDSDEFLTILCDELEKEAKKYGKENFLENSFKGKISNEIVSLDKEYPYYSKTDEDFYRVTLDIKGHKTLEEALDAYVKGEVLDGDNQYYVEKYKKKLSIRKSSSLKKLGNQIIIHLKRFEFDFVTFTNKKLNDYLVFPNEINFKKWTRAYLRSDDPNLNQDLLKITDEEKENLIDENMNYVLTGILIHSGSSLQSGHYYSLIMDQESGNWYQFNDNIITKFNFEKDLEKECFGNKNSYNNSGEEQFGRTAYLLFYTKKKLFKNEDIIKENKINEKILKDVYIENLNYLKLKTFTSNLYQDFLSKFVQNSFNVLKDTNNPGKEYSINKKYRYKIFVYNKLLEIDKKEKDNKKAQYKDINEINEEKNDDYENINKIDDEEENRYNNDDYNIPKNIEELILKINKEENKQVNDNSKEKNYTSKKVIKLLIYYTFDIVIQYFDNNIKISSFINILNNHLASNKIFCISIIKFMEKNIEFFTDLIFKCGSKNQSMMTINKEIYDYFKTIFENVYMYEKENMEIISKKFKFISKNKNTNKYEILEEYESSLFRFIKKLFCNNLERCRKEFSVDLMFLHLFYFCASSFPEISIFLNNILIPLISFITNNSLKTPAFKSKENPSFYMGGNKGWKPNENYEKILSEIILHSINNGMYNKKKLSPYFIRFNPNYNNNQIQKEENVINNFDLYPRLPYNICLIFNEEFIIKYLSSQNCTIETICNLCYEDEEISTNLLNVINNYLRQRNNRINTVEIIFNKICHLFSINDSLINLRLETLFQLNSNNPNSLFNYYDNIKHTEFVLDIIYNITSALSKYSSIYEYFLNYRHKFQWIYTYFYDIKEQGFLNDNYNKVHSYHPDFIQTIEEGLINRLGFAQPSNTENNYNGFSNGENFMDDGDDDFSIM